MSSMPNHTCKQFYSDLNLPNKIVFKEIYNLFGICSVKKKVNGENVKGKDKYLLINTNQTLKN